jgi:RNA polymerase sigma factor (sigma-70 family)
MSQTGLAFARLSFDNRARRRRVDYQRFFEAQLGLIDQIVRGVGRRFRLLPDEIDDLRSAIHLKIIENDYDVLRRFQNQSSLKTYLTTVVVHHFFDGLHARHGKWRASEEAKRLGPVAVLLEQLTMRDRVPFDQAVSLLQINHHVRETEAELEAYSRAFPSRPPREHVSDDALDRRPAPTAADDGLAHGEKTRRVTRVKAVLAIAMAGLMAKDQLLVKMIFRDAMPVSQVARLLKLEAKPLYRHLDKLKQQLRKTLEAHGVTAADLELTGLRNVDWESPESEDPEDET